jgi:hypothetical protein
VPAPYDPLSTSTVSSLEPSAAGQGLAVRTGPRRSCSINELLNAQLLEEESTLTLMAAQQEVIEKRACSASCAPIGAAISG